MVGSLLFPFKVVPIWVGLGCLTISFMVLSIEMIFGWNYIAISVSGWDALKALYDEIESDRWESFVLHLSLF